MSVLEEVSQTTRNHSKLAFCIQLSLHEAGFKTKCGEDILIRSRP